MACVSAVSAEETTIGHFGFDSESPAAGLQVTRDGASWVAASAGDLTAPNGRANAGSLKFDGTSAIVHADLGEAAGGFETGFTWEGFFLTPADNTYETDGAIADRFVTQFVRGTPGSTRMTIGLSTPKKGGLPVLCIAFAGTENRHLGRFPVEPDVWHHFAVVHKGEETYGKLLWYLDYELDGQVTLDGRSARTTLKPGGTEPLAIGARLKQNGKVDRGFQGLLDEIRLSSEPLEPGEFLRAKHVQTAASYERTIAVSVYEDLPSRFNWTFRGTEPSETIAHEAMSFSGLPPRFNQRGYKTDRHGMHGLRAVERVTLPAGEYYFLLRTNADARLTVDGRRLLDARLHVPHHPLEKLPDGPREYTATYVSDGKPHRFALSTVFRADPDQQRRDVILCYLPRGETEWRFFGHSAEIPVSPAAWARYAARNQRFFRKLEPERRELAIQRGNRAWRERHEQARQIAAAWDDVPVPSGDGNPVDSFIDLQARRAGIARPPLLGDAAFLRRLSLDLRGRIPTLPELKAFLNDDSPNKRQRAVDKMLSSDEWADRWVGYWQDVLAENPSILKPTLNNSGPFRRWIYESFRRNLPMDRFATELILMEGSNEEAGTAGFEQATLNDAPMAMKAHVVMQAFLAVDLQCARCHDSPVNRFTQGDLFSLAALLNEQPLKLPSTSVVPSKLPGGREPAVTVSLRPGQTIKPVWTLDDLLPGVDAEQIQDAAERPRELLAAVITSPRSTRFSDVMVNRVWKLYMGRGLIEPVDNWADPSEAADPELLRYLSWRFVDSGYDMKALVRLIVSSRTYRRQPQAAPAPDEPVLFIAPLRRRMTAEQLVDSMHVAVGRDFDAEELTFDPNRTRGFLNLGVPQRAWQMTSMSNERDRPALSMPVNQSIVDVLKTFGWRAERPDPVTDRDHSPNALQPLMLANGTMSSRLVRLSEESAITELCLQELTVEELADRLFLAVLSRLPDDGERQMFVELLRPGFNERRTGKPKPKSAKTPRAHVDWDKHLKAEATVELMEAERMVREGPPPTVRLAEGFRRRVEDAVWCLLNSPEFVFIP